MKGATPEIEVVSKERRTAGRVTIVPAEIWHAFGVLANLRAEDREELTAFYGSFDPLITARLHVEISDGLAWTALIDGKPEAVFGMAPLTRFVGTVWAFGTDRMWRAVPALTRYVNEVGWGLAAERGFRRAEARTLHTHTIAHQWLPKMRMHFESVMPGVGAGGEDFHLYVWRRD